MAVQQRRTARRTALLGLVGAGVMVLVVVLAFTAHSGLPFRATTTVKAAFADVASIHPDSQVRQNSLRVGRVAEIEYVDGQAVVTLELDGDQTVYADASAAVLDFSALGQKFIELHPGSPQAGPLGDRVIAAHHNENSADIYQVFDVFDPPTLASATAATRQLGAGAAGRGPELQDFLHTAPDLLADSGTVAAALSAPDADLPGLLRSADRLSARFVDRRQRITEAIAQTDQTLQGLTVDSAQPLGDSLQKLPATLDSAKTALDDLNGPLSDTEAFVTDFRAGAESLGRSEGDLRGVLREAPQPLGKVPGVSEQATPAVRDLTDTVNDARPLAPKVTTAFDRVADPVGVLAPYGPDAASLWARLRSMLSENVGGNHYGKTTFNVNGRIAGAATPGLVGSEYYPPAGTSDGDRLESEQDGGPR